MHKMYFKKDGKLSKRDVHGFSGDIKQQMANFSLSELREIVGSDKDSAIMLIVK